ncbi:extracellular catalytic domain type 2 short-chain-length polyhydroxyalkanoate depolymerase [Alteromonas sp. HB246098]
MMKPKPFLRRAMWFSLLSVSALSFSSPSFSADASAQGDVPSLTLDLENVTVSGLSSGGYMATQFQLAHSDWVKGVGVIAGGPYFCAKGDITTALAQCVNKVEGEIDLEALNKKAAQYEAEGKIASLSNMKDAKVWLFHGTQDTRVFAKVSDLLFEQYKLWTDTPNITYINDKPMAHLFPTENNGVNCMKSESPFIGNCDYDAAGAMLSHLFEELSTPDEELSGKLHSVDQQNAAGSDAKTLASEGFVYVPASCAQGEPCRAHISFHGCNQYADAVGDAYTTETGLNEWADDNNIVVLYPQTKKSLFMPLNPQGCWDWWGYASSDYANSDGAQIRAVKKLLFSLNSAPSSNRAAGSTNE